MGKRTSATATAAAAPAASGTTTPFDRDYVGFDEDDHDVRVQARLQATTSASPTTPAKRAYEGPESALLRHLKTPRHKEPKSNIRATFDIVCLLDGSACCVQEGLPLLYREITGNDLFAKGTMLHIPGVFTAKASEGCWLNRPHAGRRRGIVDNAWRPTILGQTAIIHGRDNIKQFIELDIVPEFNVIGIKLNVIGEPSPLAATIWVRMSPFSLRGGTDIVHPTIVDFREFNLIFDIPCWVPRERKGEAFDPKPVLDELARHSFVVIKRDDQPPPDLN